MVMHIAFILVEKLKYILKNTTYITQKDYVYICVREKEIVNLKMLKSCNIIMYS
jgi:hypothetical protein